MSNFVLSLLIAGGSATWIYTKLQNKSGNNTQQSLVAAGVSGLLLFIALLMIINMAL